MRLPKVWIYTIAAAIVFTSFFAVFAAAEGTSFDDAKLIGEGTYSGTVENDYYYEVNIPAYKAVLVTLTAGSDSSVSLQIYNENRQDVGIFGSASAENGASDNAFYDGQSTSQYTAYIKVGGILTSNDYTIKVEFRPGDVMSGAQGVSDSQAISDEIKYSSEVHWYKINVPKGKLLNVSFTSNGGEIDITLYDSGGKTIDTEYGTNGYVSTELLGETGTIYIQVTAYEYNKVVSYTITPHLKTGSSSVEKAGNAIGTTCLVGIIIGIVVVVLIIVLIVKMVKGKKEKTPLSQPPKPPQ